jgi:hypothetical protein
LHPKVKTDIKKNRMRLKGNISIILLVVLLLPAAHPDNLAANDDITVERMSVDELKNQLGNPDVAIIDVRRQKNWWSSTTKILTAAREDPAKVSQWYTTYPKGKILVFYCS